MKLYAAIGESFFNEFDWVSKIALMLYDIRTISDVMKKERKGLYNFNSYINSEEYKNKNTIIRTCADYLMHYKNLYSNKIEFIKKNKNNYVVESEFIFVYINIIKKIENYIREVSLKIIIALEKDGLFLSFDTKKYKFYEEINNNKNKEIEEIINSCINIINSYKNYKIPSFFIETLQKHGIKKIKWTATWNKKN